MLSRDERRATRKRCYKTYHKLLRSGMLKRPDTCSECGYSAVGRRKAKIQGHHEDYEKPEVVIWLCLNCHMRKHGKNHENVKVEEINPKLWDDKRVDELAESLGLKTW